MSLEKSVTRRVFLKGGILGIVGVAGCGINMPGPGGRLGCVPLPTFLTTYLGEDAANAQRGIAYTCKAGDIDLAHVRKYGEWSYHLAKKIRKGLENSQFEFSFSGNEPGKYLVKLDIANDLNDFSIEERGGVIDNVSIEVGKYLAHSMSIWHESLTWFGWKYTAIIPEFNSSFSWEDRFSDTFGCYVAGIAMKDKKNSFNRAFNNVLEKEFKRLEICSKSQAKLATKNVEGKWYDGEGFSGGMLVRNLDIGLRDGHVEPCIPPLEYCDGTDLWKCPAPNLNFLKKNKFSYSILIEPKSKAGRKISSIAGTDGLINPESDFAKIIGYIKKDAISKGYEVVG